MVLNNLVANNLDLNKENTQLQIFGSKRDLRLLGVTWGKARAAATHPIGACNKGGSNIH